MILEKIVLMGAGMEAGVGSQILVSTELLFHDEVHLSTRGSKNKKRGKEKKGKNIFLLERLRVGAQRFLFTVTLMNHCNRSTKDQPRSDSNAHRLYFNVSF